MRPTALAFALCAAPLAAFAQADLTGDPAAGEEAFSQCITCHVVANDAGETLAGRGAKTGPNLYGVALRQAGLLEDFRYSDSMVEAGEMGLNWSEASFVPYVQEPTDYLREYTGDRRARGKMTYKLRDEAEAYDIWAYLVSIGPEIPEDQQGLLKDASGGS